MMDRKETRDVLQWEAVEEATELLQERLFPQAMIELRRVIMANPNNPYAYFYLGVAFFETEQMEAARDAYRAAVTLAPDYLGARVSLSHVLRQLGDAVAARSVRRRRRCGATRRTATRCTRSGSPRRRRGTVARRRSTSPGSSIRSPSSSPPTR